MEEEEEGEKEGEKERRKRGQGGGGGGSGLLVQSSEVGSPLVGALQDTGEVSMHHPPPPPGIPPVVPLPVPRPLSAPAPFPRRLYLPLPSWPFRPHPRWPFLPNLRSPYPHLFPTSPVLYPELSPDFPFTTSPFFRGLSPPFHLPNPTPFSTSLLNPHPRLTTPFVVPLSPCLRTLSPILPLYFCIPTFLFGSSTPPY